MNENKGRLSTEFTTNNPAVGQLHTIVHERAGLSNKIHDGNYDYAKATMLSTIVNEALIDFDTKLREKQLVIYQNYILTEVENQGGIVQVVLDYSTKKLEQLKKEGDPEMFEEEPGKGNTVYEKVIKALNTNV